MSLQSNREASALISRLQNDIQELLEDGNNSSGIFKGIFPSEDATIQSFGEDLSGLMPDTAAEATEADSPSKSSTVSGGLSRTQTAKTLLMQENVSLQEEARERNQMIEELRSKVDMLSTILTDSVEKSAQMEEELLTQSIKISELQESEILLKKENLLLTKKVNEQTAELQMAQGFQQKMQETEAVMNNLQDEMVTTLEKLLNTRQELKQLEEIDSLRMKEIAAYNAEIEQLKEELELKKQELTAAESETFETRQSCQESIALTERKMIDLQNATDIVRLENARAKENLLRVKGAQEKWELEKADLQKSIDAWKRMSIGTIATPKASSSTVSPLRRGNSALSQKMTPRTPNGENGTAADSDANEYDYDNNIVDGETYANAMELNRNPFQYQTSFLDSAQRTYLSVAEVIASNDPEQMKSELITLAHQLEQMRSNNARLLNKLQAARGNIQVCCRTRPPTPAEVNQLTRLNKKGNRICVDVLDDNELAVFDSKCEQWRSFAFDRVWKLDATQAEVFADVEPLVMSVIDGYNCCLLAYGQTGSGKTFTMNGIGEDYGISYRTLSRIFEALELKREAALATAKKIKFAAARRLNGAITSTTADTNSYGNSPVSNREKQLAEEIAVLMAEEDQIVADLEVEPFSYKVEISIMEIYKDQIHDLLVNQPVDGNSPGLEVRQTPDGAVFVPGLIQVRLYSLEDVMAVFGRGSANRMTATTNLNERSSRSHLILQVTVTTISEDSLPVRAKLSLVDLAGSERISKSGSVGSSLKEAQYINKSLSALGDVMEALDQKHKHIPYRNSKLTYLLNDSLGGNSRTMMIVTLCPTELSTDETLFSLHFATRVRNITVGAARKNVNAKNLEDALKSIKHDLRDTRMKKNALEEQVLALKRELKAKAERAIVQLDTKARTLDDTKKYADIQIQQYSRQNRDLMMRLQEEKTEKSQISLELSATRRDLSKFKEKIRELNSEKEILTREVKHKDREIAHLRLRQTSRSSFGEGIANSSSMDLSVCSRNSSPDKEVARSNGRKSTSPARISLSHSDMSRESAVRMLEEEEEGYDSGSILSHGNRSIHSNYSRDPSLSPKSAAAAAATANSKVVEQYKQHIEQQSYQTPSLTPERAEIATLHNNSSISVGNLIARYDSGAGAMSESIHLESYTHPTLVGRSPESPHDTMGYFQGRDGSYSNTPGKIDRFSPRGGSAGLEGGYGSSGETPSKHQAIIVGANGGATPASAHYRPKMTPRSKEALLKHQQRLTRNRLSL